MAQKIFIVGAGGMVGSVCAYNIMQKELAKEIILIDIDKTKVEGQALDLFHSAAYTLDTRVRTGDYSEIKEDDIIIVTAGIAQKPGQSRLDLTNDNKKIIESIVDNIMMNKKNVFIVMVTNPVDVLTYTALKRSGLSKNRVFGSGTGTDTIRLIAHLAEKLNVSYDDVSGYVIGEHGDSCFTSISQTKVQGESLENLLATYQLSEEELNEYLRKAALQIIEAKGATYFGIATVVGEIVDSLVNNKNETFNVCSLLDGEYGLSDVVLGIPHRINSNGAEIIEDFQLTPKELDQLNKSAAIISEYINK